MWRNRCSFVKVALTPTPPLLSPPHPPTTQSESRDAFESEVNTQFHATILTIHSAQFHGGLAPRQDQEALALHTQQRRHHGNHTGTQPAEFSHSTFISFFYLFFFLASASETTASAARNPPLKARRPIHVHGERRLAHSFCVSTSELDFSYLMDDLRHWQLVHV